MPRTRSPWKNLLIVSDLHLGEGLREAMDGQRVVTVPGGGKNDFLQQLEREFSAFLIHYTAERIRGRPWRLIINGDMVDFMSILLLPQPVHGPHPPEQVVEALENSRSVWGPEEVFGLGSGAEASRLKLERVMGHHEAVFRLLGRFVAAGNDLVIVLGNHDIEFSHRQVQRAFVRRLVGLATDREARSAAVIARQVARRVRFCPWFYYEKDRVYVEHGHQYDEYCSFDYQLCPSNPSFAHLGMRFFGNVVPAYDQRTAEHWGVTDYLRWGITLGLRPLLWLAYLYGLLAWKTAAIGKALLRPMLLTPRRQRHHFLLRAVARRHRLKEDTLLALDALRVTPLIHRVLKIITALFIDRIIMAGLVVLVLTALLVLLPGALGKLLAVAGMAAGAVGANAALHRLRGETSPSALRRVTRTIHRLVQAPLIVFGHTHEAERTSLGAPGKDALPGQPPAVYINTGAWMQGAGTHIGTHLVIQGTQAELRKWGNGQAIKLEL